MKLMKALALRILYALPFGRLFLDSEYRKRVTRERIEKWIDDAERTHRSIAKEEADALRFEVNRSDILDVLQLYPLWLPARLPKPPFIGTVANFVLAYMIFKEFVTAYTLNTNYLTLLFADGVLRFLIAVAFTGLKYEKLLLLSLIPTFGFFTPIPAQIMNDTPRLSTFLMKDVLAARIGTLYPGVSRNSFSVYFYKRFMNLPLLLMRAFAWLGDRLYNYAYLPLAINIYVRNIQIWERVLYSLHFLPGLANLLPAVGKTGTAVVSASLVKKARKSDGPSGATPSGAALKVELAEKAKQPRGRDKAGVIRPKLVAGLSVISALLF
jgi:hypothetical protein